MEGEDAAREWLRDGQKEHASIASFTRFSLDLLRFAAPPALLTAAHSAAMDEVRHATAAFSLAAHFRGDDNSSVQVNPFPTGDFVDLAPSLSSFAARAFEEGCRGESAHVVRLVRANAAAELGSPVKQVLRELIVDELRHAALAWATVIWAVSRGAVVATTHAAHPRKSWASRERDQHALTWAGRVPLAESDEIDELVERYWVGPWSDAVADGRTLPPVIVGAGVTSEALASAVEEAAQSVQQLVSDGDLATGV